MKRRSFIALILSFPWLLKAKLLDHNSRDEGMKIHRASERGSAEHGWLHSRFSFSFANYYDPQRMGFGALRVINDDIVEAGTGFGTHPHQNMEIVSIVMKGALEHKDSFGNHGVIKAGEIQYMSAGNGVYHSEYNPSKTEAVEFFQIWIVPKSNGGEPIYDQRDFSSHDQKNQWVTLVSNAVEDDAMMIKQDAKILTTELEEGKTLHVDMLDEGYGRLLFVIDGSLDIDGTRVDKRDEVQITDDKEYKLTALKDTKVMMLEVPMDV
jgi:quercetin 2,3-dioxygenase